MGSRLRTKLTYANVMATIAVFIALGGTGYAATQLPRNSVGTKQIRTGGVGASELRSSAVTSRDIRNGTISTRDMSASARRSLTGPAGPAGPIGPAGSATDYRAIVVGAPTDDTGRAEVRDNRNGEYRVYFEARTGRPAVDVSKCAFTATLARIETSPGTVSDPEAGRIVVGAIRDDGGSGALVKTYGADGAPKPQSFHITASC